MGRRWRRYRYGYRQRYRAYPTSTRDLASSEANCAADFIRREFFEMDYATRQLVVQFYGREYGENARRYLEKTFEKWRTGEVVPRRQTENRILHCVPRFLSDQKQFSVLSFYIPRYLNQLRAAGRSQHVTLNTIPTAYANVAQRCRELEPKLDWFVEGIFSKEEVAAFAEVVRYSALDRLHRSYSAVRLDLTAAMPSLLKIDASVQIGYRIDEFSSVVPVDEHPPALPLAAFSMPTTPQLVVRHREQYEQVMVEHACDMQVQAEAQRSRHSVAKLDLSMLQKAINSVSRSDSVESNFKVCGAGGIFEGRVIRKNLPALKANLFGRITTAVLATIGGIAAVVALLALDSGFFICSLLLGLPLLFGLWIWVGEKYQEVKDYERSRTTRFTTGN